MRPITRCITRIISLAGVFVMCGMAHATFGKAAPVALVPNQPDAPPGFDGAQASVGGNSMSFAYEPKGGGGNFRATIYTPPGFSTSKKYPVLYLLHGADGNESTWMDDLQARNILDNLFDAGKLAPMLVVMPSSLSDAARKQAGRNREARTKAGMTFDEVLLRDLIPLIESKYPVLAGREHRALAGLGTGAELALNTALLNPDTFAWVGAFSGGNTNRLADASRFDVTSPGRETRLLWLSVGSKDKVMAAGVAAVDAFLAERKVPHVFHINDGGHEAKVWMNDLYHFAPLLFKEVKAASR